MARLLVIDPQPALSRELAGWMARSAETVEWAASIQEARTYLEPHPPDAILVDESSNAGKPLEGLQSVLARVPTALLTRAVDVETLAAWQRKGVSVCLIKPYHARELTLALLSLLRRQLRIVSLGGGSGLYTLLLGLKTLPKVHLTAVVTMSDDGGSSGRIREAFGMLPPGDVRRCLVALSTAPDLMNELFQYRFSTGDGLRDHSLGNLLLTAMADVTGSMGQAVRAMGDILHTQGIVLPVTDTLCTLVAQLADGSVVRGEHRIDVPEERNPNLRITRLWHEPKPVANPHALAAILSADAITIGPGDLFTSILATLTIGGIAEAIRESLALKIYICNLMTKPGETSGFSVKDHVHEILRYLGSDLLDAVLISNTAVSEEACRAYAAKDQQPVRLDDPPALAKLTRARVVARDVGLDKELVRHDAQKLAQEVAALTWPLFERKTPPAD